MLEDTSITPKSTFEIQMVNINSHICTPELNITPSLRSAILSGLMNHSSKFYKLCAWFIFKIIIDYKLALNHYLTSNQNIKLKKARSKIF